MLSQVSVALMYFNQVGKPLQSHRPDPDYYSSAFMVYAFDLSHSRITCETESLSSCGRTPWTSDQLEARPLPTEDSTVQKDIHDSRSSVRAIRPQAFVRAL
jgi:hypothetical protein